MNQFEFKVDFFPPSTARPSRAAAAAAQEEFERVSVEFLTKHESRSLTAQLCA